MAQCTVYVYDEKLAAASGSFIEIHNSDHMGTYIDLQPAQQLGPSEFGAKLNLPNPPEPIKIWVDDTSGQLAPTSLAHLNGKMTARLDVILYSLPVPPGGGGGGRRGGASSQAAYEISAHVEPSIGDLIEAVVAPAADWGAAQSPIMTGAQSTNALGAYIDRQVASGNWSGSEASGVRSLVETVTLAMNTPQLNPQLRPKLERWRTLLSDLGIEISAQVRQEKSHGGGHSQGGTQMQTATS